MAPSFSGERLVVLTENIAVRISPIIRSFQREDQSKCQKIFKDGYQEFIKNLTIVYLLLLVRYIAIAAVFAILAAGIWSAWIFAVFVVMAFMVLAFICIYLQLSGWLYSNHTLKSGDLKDIEETYMSNKNSRMWVAELNGSVVGMVGLLHNENFEQGVYELKRMYIVPNCRGMGIAKHLINELISHAKTTRLKLIMVKTTSTLMPAIQLYTKNGFTFSSDDLNGKSTDVPAINKRNLPKDVHLKLDISSLAAP
ncbi:N-acetyltransferase 8-like [Stylophora pistillata]|uniref:N-acetyltransferase 8-like n=1 Tax=Stylophora pistillata TaxID=50429 RepID=UPI000C045F6C|nr:N-acetyltransferase 8-like [Stylophora pistillata]